jgi:hypothetical protein
MTRHERRLAAEAALVSTFVRVGLKTLSFAALRRTLDVCSRRRALHSHGSVSSIAAAVERASRRVPGRRTCLVDALTADVMLRRRGYAPTVHLGVRKQRDRLPPLIGHAWVVCNGQVVIGSVAELSDYAVMPVEPAR